MMPAAHQGIDILGLADQSPDDGPKWDLRPGDIVAIGRPDEATFRRAEFERPIPGRKAADDRPAGPRTLRFSEIPSGAQVFLTDRQIGLLQREGRWSIELINADADKPRGELPTNLGLTDEETRYADCHFDYVVACVAMPGGYKKSRPKLLLIVEEVARKRAEAPPSTSTVMRQVQKWFDRGDVYGKAALTKKRREVNSLPPWPPEMIQAIRSCTYQSLCDPKGTAGDALARLRIWADETYPERQVDLPNIRTMERARASVNKYIRDYLGKGAGKSARDNAAYYERSRPDLPCEEVEVDHTTFDVRLIDDESNLVFGRPDVVAIRCLATGMILGIGIGWEAPSFASFIEAVRHAMYEKDLSAFPSVKTGWPCRGRWKRMRVDNAMHFIGANIGHASNELMFEVVEMRPGEPTMKGAVERLMGILNRKVAHAVPGTTLSNIVERKEHEEASEAPVLTLREFEAFLVTYICDDYHWSAHRGLGPLRKLPDVPIRLWRNGIGKVKIRNLPHPDTFAALAGDIENRTVQDYGIEWDYILYQSDDLIPIRTHPDHKPGKGRHPGTKYRVTRDPQDLGRIWLFDPYLKVRIEVPSARLDYAAGLTLHQHRVIVADHLRTVANFVDIDGLLRTRGRMLATIQELRKQRDIQGIERKLARFLGSQKAKRIRSRIATENDSEEASSVPLDIEQPAYVPTPEFRARRAPNLTRREQPDPERVRQVKAEPEQSPAEVPRRPKVEEQAEPERRTSSKATDLDALRAQHPDWKEV
ncbi:Mu transposase C-terminal domain-containing protein [Methylobacterium sp. GC_Met_2]|uniref:Mu transposase C-terminal domain-containing protein n=1 Tax=Methylobacterium sp. GC_Met_2 TaxID=2937376 RepID=UPI00226B03DA|nr:Mu transposase C-terminal domain-containing protein [Methylobacterium sp. GC_Met_2]